MASLIYNFWEKYAPWLGIVVGCLMAHLAGSSFQANVHFLSALASVTAILCGLTGVSLSILLATKVEALEQLKAANGYGKLIGMVRYTIITSLLSTFIALAGLTGIAKCAAAQIYNYALFATTMSATFSFVCLFWLITKAGIVDAKIAVRKRWGKEKSD